MDLLSNFAGTLNDLIVEHNLNARTLALALGIDNSTVTRYLNGKRLPSLENLVKIANYFNISSDYLLGLEDEISNTNFLPCPPFAERLAFLLNHYKCSSYSIYNKTDISQVRYYDWKNGVSVPNVDNVVRLAKLLDCSVDFVIGRSKV
ncbi:MAG: transcriptional regulator [Clostridia bacterium]|nr:transcriptional regulator [Clostridia bacterium]